MKVLFLTAGNILTPSSRYRVYQFIPELNNRGMQTQVITPPQKSYSISTLQDFFGIIRLIRNVDVVFIQKRRDWIARWISKIHHSVVFDFDDAVFHPGLGFNFSERKFQRGVNNLNAILRVSKLVICGNSYLASYASQFSNSIHILPTVVDTDLYQIRENNHRSFIIGWVGLGSNLVYLKTLEPVFERISGKYGSNVAIKIISDKSISMRNTKVAFQPWSLEGEIDDLQDLDIGVMPLPDDERARGKCGFKLIQYMALGKASIASPVGVNREIIVEGENGFLASSEDEWFHKISNLLDNKELRARMGLNARKTVEKNYSLRATFPKLFDLLINLKK